MRFPLLGPGLALAVLGTALSLGTAAEAAAPPGAGPLASRLSAPWPALQRTDGSFYDYVHPKRDGRYSEAMIGLGLLQAGILQGDDELVDTGLRAFDFALAHGDRQLQQESTFESYAMAAAYNLLRSKLPGDERFARLRPRWETWLRRVRPVYMRRPRKVLFNKHLVEVAAWVELVRTGLRSTVPGTVLADPERATARVTRHLTRVIPRLTRRERTRIGLVHTRLFADPPVSPLAYHALSLGFYARALQRLGPRAGAPATRTLLEAARASLALSSPTGDLAYAGRSQEQAWALSLTSYGVETAARLTSDVRERAALVALAGRARRRLRALHPPSPRGIALTPALASGDAGLAGLDFYADSVAYAGLTIVPLGWSVGDGPVSGGGAPPPRLRQAVLPMPRGGLAIVRTGRIWFAVRGAGYPKGDLRSDFGLVGLAVRRRNRWRTVLRPRPKASLQDGGAGPVLLRDGRRRPPAGGRLTARRGVVTARAGWARIRYRALRCGVRESWRGRRGDVFERSVFFRAGARPHRTGRMIRGGGQRVTASSPIAVSYEGGYVSGSDRKLVRARIRLRAPRTGSLRLTICSD